MLLYVEFFSMQSTLIYYVKYKLIRITDQLKCIKSKKYFFIMEISLLILRLRISKIITDINIYLRVKNNDINLLVIYFESQSQM